MKNLYKQKNKEFTPTPYHENNILKFISRLFTMSPQKEKSFSRKHMVSGFTLIEVMVASGIFVSVMIIGIGVLLSVNKSHKNTEAMRGVLDNINFVMEDVSRNIRLATNIVCPAGSVLLIPDCPPPTPGSGILAQSSLVFEGLNGDPDDDGDQIVYWFVPNDDDPTKGYLVKSINGYFPQSNNQNYKRITPEGVVLDLTKSGFSVVGQEDGDGRQAAIHIRLNGEVMYQSSTLPFSIQTTISNRNIGS